MTMGLLSIPATVRQRRVRPWGRQPRRPWVRPDDVGGVSRLLAAIPSLPRAELSRLTTRLIDRMDEIDGDPDREPVGDERDTSLPEWNQLWPIWQNCGLPDEEMLALEDDEDSHDREYDEQEERHA